MHWSHAQALATLIDGLRTSPEFDFRWDAHPIGEKHRGTKRLTHPEVGDLELDYEVLDLQGDDELQMITWLAADPATAQRLATLTGGPGGLRLVEGR